MKTPSQEVLLDRWNTLKNILEDVHTITTTELRTIIKAMEKNDLEENEEENN